MNNTTTTLTDETVIAPQLEGQDVIGYPAAPMATPSAEHDLQLNSARQAQGQMVSAPNIFSRTIQYIAENPGTFVLSTAASVAVRAGIIGLFGLGGVGIGGVIAAAMLTSVVLSVGKQMISGGPSEEELTNANNAEIGGGMLSNTLKKALISGAIAGVLGFGLGSLADILQPDDAVEHSATDAAIKPEGATATGKSDSCIEHDDCVTINPDPSPIEYETCFDENLVTPMVEEEFCVDHAPDPLVERGVVHQTEEPEIKEQEAPITLPSAEVVKESTTLERPKTFLEETTEPEENIEPLDSIPTIIDSLNDETFSPSENFINNSLELLGDKRYVDQIIPEQDTSETFVEKYKAENANKNGFNIGH